MVENIPKKYEHYLLGDTVPIRVVFNANGLKIGAMVPSREDGELVHNATYLSRLSHSFEVDKISEEQFKQICAEQYGVLVP